MHLQQTKQKQKNVQFITLNPLHHVSKLLKNSKFKCLAWLFGLILGFRQLFYRPALCFNRFVILNKRRKYHPSELRRKRVEKKLFFRLWSHPSAPNEQSDTFQRTRERERHEPVMTFFLSFWWIFSLFLRIYFNSIFITWWTLDKAQLKRRI